MTKDEYKRLAESLRIQLVNAQYDLKDADTSVVILLAGNDLAACEEFIDVLQEWVDVRYIDTHAFRLPTEEEVAHPPLWRYWQAMPSNGRTAIFYGAWVMNLLLEIDSGNIAESELETRLNRLNELEALLRDDGKKVLKLWLHSSEDELKKRLKKAKKNPQEELYVGKLHKQIYQVYKRSDALIERLNALLSQDVPWQWVDAGNKRSRNIGLAQRLLGIMQAGVQHKNTEPRTPRQALDFLPAQQDYLGGVDLSLALEYDEYKRLLKQCQHRLKQALSDAYALGVTPIFAFEGWDAAGKGGVIRRITQALSVWEYRVIPIAAPTDEELSHHYLWRFWRHIPRKGKTLIFDRTWYGRVLVERVEGFARDDEWQRAYDEINQFEAQLDEAKCCVVKFWLHIDQDEQLARFCQRELTEYKKYKITDEDYRNREKWPAYYAAVNDMVQHTATEAVPWYVIPANDKRMARVTILQTLCERLEEFNARVQEQ